MIKMVRVNPYLIDEIKKYGAFDITACFNCGTCTAICPLSPLDGEGYEFPRIIIRYAILGLEDKLVSAPQLWQCYYCGECTRSCPRDADPGGFMMAARRFAIAEYSWGKIGNIFFSTLGNIIALTILSLLFLFGIYLFHGPMNLNNLDILTFIPKGLIHTAGLYLGLFVTISAFLNISIMYMSVRREFSTNVAVGWGKRLAIWLKNLIDTFIKEMLIQMRYQYCENRNRYYAHMALFWGFILDFLATGLVYMIDLEIIIISSTLMRLTARIIGIIGGILLIYGSSYFIKKRMKKDEEFSEYSHISDWVFTLLLFLIGLTGLFLTVTLYLYEFLKLTNSLIILIAYSTFTLHLLFAFDLLVTAPFSKFAHAGYRPFALWILRSNTEIKRMAKEHETKQIEAITI